MDICIEVDHINYKYTVYTVANKHDARLPLKYSNTNTLH